MQLDDNHLMERVKSGDSAAFEQLFRKYEHAVLNFLHKLCFSQTLAEDLTQETFLRLWRSRHSFKPGSGRFSTYLFQIAKNHWLSFKQTKKYQARMSSLEHGDIQHATGEADPGRETESAELRQRLRTAIESLPDELRIPFVLSRYEGLRYEDIGRVLEISPRTVERKVSDAAKLLADRILKG